jgi:hypothetical protein
MATKKDTLVELVWINSTSIFMTSVESESVKNLIPIGSPKLITYRYDTEPDANSVAIAKAVKEKAPKGADAFCRAELNDGITIPENPGHTMVEPVQYYKLSK